MKKLLFVAVLGVIALSSCKKEKDCECTSKSGGVVAGTTTTTIKDGECADMNTSATTMGVTVSTECVEK